MNKKTICIILAMVMFLLVSCDTTISTSIQTDTPNVTDTPTAPQPTVDLKNISYTVYSDPQYIDLKAIKPVNSDGVVLDHNGNTISYAESSLPIFNGGADTISSDKDPEAAPYRTVTLNGKEYQLNYDKTAKLKYADCIDKQYHKFGYI